MFDVLNVDVIDTLYQIMDNNTTGYKTDFKYDEDKFGDAALSKNATDKHILWMSRDCGTWAFREHDVYLPETWAANTWSFYRNLQDNIKAFAVEVTDCTGDNVIGNIYELNYKQHVDEVERVRADFHVGEVYVVFNSNEKHAFGADEFNKNRMAIADRYGSIKDTHYFCSDEPKLCATLQETRTEREQNAQPCTIDEYMKEEFSSEDELEP